MGHCERRVNMSEHTNEKTIANQAETIRLLIASRDFWRESCWKSESRYEELRDRLENLEQKGGA